MDENSPREAPPLIALDLESKNNNFGLLRVLLATLVVFSHGPELADGDRHREALSRIFGTLSLGGLAVDGFFLISGFLIVKSWTTKPHLGLFLRNRILRIYPGFIVASILCVYLVGPIAGLGQVDPLSQIRPVVKHIVLLQQPTYPVSLSFKHYQYLDGAMWTISWEFGCYLLVAMMGLLGLSKWRWPWLVLSIATLVLTARRDHHGIDEQSWARFVALFSTGALFYVYRDKITYKAWTCSLAFFGLVTLLCFSLSAQLGLAIFGGYLLFAFAFARVPHIAHIGTKNDLSYGLYLYAWPIQQLTLLFLPKAPLYSQIAVTLVLSCIAGFLSWFLVEKQALKLKPKTERLPRPSSSVAL